MALDKLNLNVGQALFAKTAKKEAAEEAKAEEKPQQQAAAPQKEVSAKETFAYMGAGAQVVAPKTIDPAKYVDKVSAERIAELMAMFTEKVEANIGSFTAEGLSPQAAQYAALAKVNKEMA